MDTRLAPQRFVSHDEFSVCLHKEKNSWNGIDDIHTFVTVIFEVTISAVNGIIIMNNPYSKNF